jgi:RNA polymerase sigma-70 factor (ECF subfamily)
MARLNEADRTALTLFLSRRIFIGRDRTITGMQANTAKVRIHRARQRLADELTNILNHGSINFVIVWIK